MKDGRIVTSYRFKLASTCAAFPAARPGHRGEIALPFPVAIAAADDMIVDDPVTGAIDDPLFDHAASSNGGFSDDDDSKLVDVADVDWKGTYGNQVNGCIDKPVKQHELHDFAADRAISVESGSSSGIDGLKNDGAGLTVDRALSIGSEHSKERRPTRSLDPDDKEMDIPRYDDPQASGSEDDDKPLGPASPARRLVQRDIERFFESKTSTSPLKGSWQ